MAWPLDGETDYRRANGYRVAEHSRLRNAQAQRLVLSGGRLAELVLSHQDAFTHTLDPGDKEPDACMVDRWREHLPSPDGDNWVLLTEQVPRVW